MAELIRGLEPDRVRENLAAVRAEIDRPGVEVIAAVKYVALEELGALVEAGVTRVGENRAQDLAAKAATPAGAELTWDFIGVLQSRKVKQVLPLVERIHSVATASAVEQLARHAPFGTRVLVEVNVAREEGKGGIAPEELDAFLATMPPAVEVTGLMTMPPFVADAEDSRRHFAALAQLAGDRGLAELSMGTTQDFAVAAQEGATLVRVGTRLFR